LNKGTQQKYKIRRVARKAHGRHIKAGMPSKMPLDEPYASWSTISNKVPWNSFPTNF